MVDDALGGLVEPRNEIVSLAVVESRLVGSRKRVEEGGKSSGTLISTWTNVNGIVCYNCVAQNWTQRWQVVLSSGSLCRGRGRAGPQVDTGNNTGTYHDHGRASATRPHMYSMS